MAFEEHTFFKIMLLYSIITFHLGPKLSKYMNKNYKDPCMNGMIGGFIVSMILWKKYGYNMSYGGNKSY